MNNRNPWPGESKFLGWLYLFPGLVIYVLFILYPIVETFRLSFFEWDGFSSNRLFIGLQNYAEIFQRGQFLSALVHNLIFIIFYCFIPIFIGLVLASLLGRRALPGMAFYRAGLFLPQVLSMVVVGVVWRWIFNPAFGPLNILLKTIGLKAWALPWLGDSTWALPAIGLIGSWVQYGFCMVLFLAGMQRIPLEFYEAAELDGANEVQQLIYISIPSLRPEMGVALITTVIAALRVFDLVFVTTRGGPGDATLVTSFLVYRAAFQQNRIGYAAAVATIMTCVILLISYGITRFQAKAET
ncbi:MAG: sugar ABC transporter permease [Anaerolineales bacterium]|nr:sugar ABC transporter permease [Anaerolineae bacterium]PWB54486.1 MAG: sugar ABC transporter permease [Anaerolineales bacterium]